MFGFCNIIFVFVLDCLSMVLSCFCILVFKIDVFNVFARVVFVNFGFVLVVMIVVLV